MVRGIYTGASAMAAKIMEMNVVSNNLANVDTTGFKKDLTLFKAFPEMLIRRQNDDGVLKFPLGSIDRKPVVGRLGTGVEVNEVYTQFKQANLTETHNKFDFAIATDGFIVVQTPKGERYTRNGSFMINNENTLVTKDGYPVLGENGPIKIKVNNFTIKKDGKIYVNKKFKNPENRMVQEKENSYDEPVLLDSLKLVSFRFNRYLKKEGNSFYRSTVEAGVPKDNSDGHIEIIQGFIERSNVNPVSEMVKMIEVQRSYEASQKSIKTEDDTLGKLINNMPVV